MSILMALVDRLIGIPYNAPLFGSFGQGRSRRHALAACALSTLALSASAAALLTPRRHLGLS